MNVLFLAALSFVQVAAKAFQQKNVMHDQYRAVIPISYLMAVMEVAFIGVSAIEITSNGYEKILPIALAYGTGSWAGCWFAMWLHKRLRK